MELTRLKWIAGRDEKEKGRGFRPENAPTPVVSRRRIPWSHVLGALAILCIGCATGTWHLGKADRVLKPKALKAGDTIGFVSPSSSIEREAMERAIRILEERGYQTKVPAGLYDSDGYLAGGDRARAEQFMAVMTDPEVDAVFAAAGGYGAMRMLPYVDFDQLVEPKLFTGFSDITALHLALWNECRWTTFHSPNMIDGFGRVGRQQVSTRQWFWELLEGDGTNQDLRSIPVEKEREDCPVPVALVGGLARGRLVGGNLSLISALVGTDKALDTDDCILFLEDVGERPYRIDRMLSQMQLAGDLDRLAGVLLGQFTDCEPRRPDATWDVDRVLQHYFGELGVPVLANFPSGHHSFNSIIPLGYQVELDADKGQVRLAEPLWRESSSLRRAAR